MKRLIVCCDGTWNDLDMETPTNVVSILQGIATRQVNDEGSVLQLAYYDEGVGTSSGNKLTNLSEKLLGGGLGFGLDHNVRQAYRFLVNNYEAGDEIYLFGFSRGAYTVRSLVGMISCAGLLSRKQITEISEAYELYRSVKDRLSIEAEQFRAINHSIEPDITFLGCWDTVGALGIPDKLPLIDLNSEFNQRFKFINAKVSPLVKHARHAVAIDEHRREFDYTPMEPCNNAKAVNQDLKELWFAGDHGCIGGGSRYKEALSSIALGWMAKEAQQVGLQFEPGFFSEINARQNCLAFYPENKKLIYSYDVRSLPADASFHASALTRLRSVFSYQQSLKDPVFNNFIARAIQSGQRLTTDPQKPVAIDLEQKVNALVYARELPNNTGLQVSAGQKYRISVSPHLYWQDESIVCNADGWNIDSEIARNQFESLLGHVKKSLVKAGRSGRISPDNDWFTLLLCFDEDPDANSTVYQLTSSAPLEMSIQEDGVLYAFANDYKKLFIDKYSNNKGWLPIVIERIK